MRIDISEDRSAQITYHNMLYDDECNPQITDSVINEDSLFTGEIFVKNIKEIDSLSVYMYPFAKDYFHIKYDSDSLIIRENNVSPIDKNCNTFFAREIMIHTSQKIVDILGKGTILVSRDSNNIVIHKTRKQYLKQKNRLDFTVVFGENNDSLLRELRKGKSYSGACMTLIPEFGIGSTNGEIANYVSDNSYLNWAFGYDRNKIRYSIRFSQTYGVITKDLLNHPDWKSTMYLTSTNHEIGIGYRLLNTTFFAFTPSIFAGVKQFNLASPITHKLIAEENRMFSYALDGNLAIKVNSFFRNALKRDSLKHEYIYLSITGSYRPNFFDVPFGIKGGSAYLSFGVGWYWGGTINYKKLKLKS